MNIRSPHTGNPTALLLHNNLAIIAPLLLIRRQQEVLP